MKDLGSRQEKVSVGKEDSPASSGEVLPDGQVFSFPPLDSVTTPTLPTDATAHYLNRKKQTLLGWACYGGPIKPLRINGRLAWPVSEIRKLTGVAQ